MTTHDQGTLVRRGTRGPALYFYMAVPDRKPAAVVGVLHGYGEYGERYLHVMDAWAKRGIASVAIDLRGHGRAGGRRGFCEQFGEFLDDTAELTRLVEERDAPAFLFGHSFGGLVAASTVLARPTPWRALLLSAPLFGIALKVGPIKAAAGRLASRLLPTLALPNGIQSDQVTHDAALARAYEKDPLVFHVATARWYTEVQDAQKKAFAEASRLTMPLFLTMGTADPVARVDRARAFFDATGAPDKTWDACAGLLHEVLNEPEWPAIADRLAAFILAHA